MNDIETSGENIWHYNNTRYSEAWDDRDQLFYFNEKMYRERRDFPFPRREYYLTIHKDQIYYLEQVMCEILFEQNEETFSQYKYYIDWLKAQSKQILFQIVHLNNAYNYFVKKDRLVFIDVLEKDKLKMMNDFNYIRGEFVSKVNSLETKYRNFIVQCKRELERLKDD